jgi:succinate dehydrogenase/fumarate reductase flavoprotein subunit
MKGMSSDPEIIVVGYGFAGGMSAIAAHDAGARVLLLEKQPEPGGISVCSAGGIRATTDAEGAFAYLQATNAGTTPPDVLRRLAEGMAEMPSQVRALGEAVGIRTEWRPSPANYPFPGYDSFGFVYVDHIAGFDPRRAFPHVRGSAAGARLFKLVMDNIALRPGIDVRFGLGAERLLVEKGEVVGISSSHGEIYASKAVILACGGFEGDEATKLQFWPLKPVLSAAVRTNTGDGMRMAQAAGAAVWHTWHYHGSYGFRHPDPSYPFGIRLKRLPDWLPGTKPREDVRMSWILVDQAGQRFVNEYEPYMQDTGHRAMELFDPVSQSFPRVPAYLIVDSRGRELYPLSAPTWHDIEVARRYGDVTPAGFDDTILTEAATIADLAARFGVPAEKLEATIRNWNAQCRDGNDATFGRPASSMVPIETPPFYAAPVWPIVSNTQGGPVHDAEQRVLDAFGRPIPRLYEAGEIGSVFGHLYMSGGNIAECFVGGTIAGRAAAALPSVSRKPASA